MMKLVVASFVVGFTLMSAQVAHAETLEDINSDCANLDFEVSVDTLVSCIERYESLGSIEAFDATADMLLFLGSAYTDEQQEACAYHGKLYELIWQEPPLDALPYIQEYCGS